MPIALRPGVILALATLGIATRVMRTDATAVRTYHLPARGALNEGRSLFAIWEYRCDINNLLHRIFSAWWIVSLIFEAEHGCSISATSSTTDSTATWEAIRTFQAA